MQKIQNCVSEHFLINRFMHKRYELLFILNTISAIYLHIGKPSLVRLWYHESPTSWYETEESCARLGGHLASVSNAFENAFLSNSWNFGSSAYWLGGSVGVTSSGAWSWTDGKSFSYANWAEGLDRTSSRVRSTFNLGQQSSTSAAKEHCLSVNLRTRLWFSTDCELNLPFICRYSASTKVPTAFTCPPSPMCTPPPVSKCPAPATCPPIPPPIQCTPPPEAQRCPAGWTFLALTKKCYKVSRHI